jgi:hypothetical protein
VTTTDARQNTVSQPTLDYNAPKITSIAATTKPTIGGVAVVLTGMHVSYVFWTLAHQPTRNLSSRNIKCVRFSGME